MTTPDPELNRLQSKYTSIHPNNIQARMDLLLEMRRKAKRLPPFQTTTLKIVDEIIRSRDGQESASQTPGTRAGARRAGECGSCSRATGSSPHRWHRAGSGFVVLARRGFSRVQSR